MSSPRRSSSRPARPGRTPETAELSGPQGSRRDRSAIRIAAVVLTLIWAAVFFPQLFGRERFILGDARVYQPFSEFSRQRWHEHHERTFWNPYVMNGVSASASLADMRPQYLPGPVLDLAEALRPGPLVPLAAPLLAHLAGMLAVALLAWRLWSLPAVGLVWAGAAFGFSPLLLVPFGFGHDAFLVACSLLPVALVATHALFNESTTWRVAGATLALALIEGVQSLTGHPQVVVYSGVVVLAFAIQRAFRTRRLARVPLVLLALAWGAATSMAVWLPAMEYARFSVRRAGVSLAEARGLSLAWYELVTFVWPQAVGGSGETYWGGLTVTDYPRFIGSLVLPLAFATAFGARQRRPRELWFLLAMVLLPMMLALGPRFGTFYVEIVRRVPFFDKFRVTSMALFVAVLGSALLSAHAFAAPGDGAPRARPRRPLRVAVAVFTAMAATLGVLLAGGRLDDAYVALALRARPDLATHDFRFAAHAAGFDLAWRLALVAAGTVALALWRSRPRLRLVSAAALVALLLADVLPVSLPTLALATGTQASLVPAQVPLLASVAAAHPESRVLSLRAVDTARWKLANFGKSPELRSNDWIRWRANAYAGEHGTPAWTWRGLEMLQSVEALRALGIVYVSIVPGQRFDPRGMERIVAAPDEEVYRLTDGLGRAYAVPSVESVASDSAAVARMLALGFEPANLALTSETGLAGDYPGSRGCTVRWIADTPDTIVLETRATDRAFVVLADTWFPGWRATLDESPLRIARVNGMVRGFAIPAGTHRLAMTFVPDGWTAALPVTRAAMALWLCATCAWAIVGALARLRPMRRTAIA